MTDLGERTLKCYLLHTGSIADESEFKDWYQQRHRRLAEELEYKSTLAETKAWLSCFTFRDILRRHQWKQRQDGAREGEYLHECTAAPARYPGSRQLLLQGHLGLLQLHPHNVR